jgi:hypothetical protein
MAKWRETYKPHMKLMNQEKQARLQELASILNYMKKQTLL